MKILSFPSSKLNSTRNLFEIIKKSPLYKRLEKLKDVIFINIDSENLHELYQNPDFYAEWFDDTKFKVAIVHDVDTSSIPFLKVADHLIFFNDIQSNVVNDIIGMDTPFTVIPYPKTLVTEVDKKSQVLFTADFDTELCDKYLHVAKTWSAIDDDGDEFDIIQIEGGITTVKSNKELQLKEYPFIAYFKLTKDELVENTRFFAEFKAILKENTTDFQIFYQTSSNKMTYEKLLAESEYSYIFNEEMSTNEAMDLIESKSNQIIYTNITENALLAESLSNKCRIIVSEGISTSNLDNRPSVDIYIQQLLNVIKDYKKISFSRKKKLKRNTTLDSLNDINIILGKPLSNKYVFVVNFRNQRSKIFRCIESILEQDRKYDFGIAITDDCSGDGSLDVILDLLDRSGIDYIVTQTIERKYSARNLYNAVHLLVTNPESVIIEVDGDDFLYSNKVLNTLDGHYNIGTLKTFGNFITFPVNWEEMENNTKRIDSSVPWNQGKCSSWLPLRSFKKHLFDSVELPYFLDRRDMTWLKVADDASINPRMMELAGDKIVFIKDKLYGYDVSGEEHDVGDEWSPIPSYKMLYHVITF